MELLTGVLFGLMAWQYGYSLETIGACVFTAYVVAMTFIDADTQLLPDELTLPLIWFGLLFNLKTGFVPLEQAVIGAMVGYMSLWTLYWAFKLLTGKEGMGYGDFKLLAAIGAWLGVAVIPITLLVASVVGIAAFFGKTHCAKYADGIWSMLSDCRLVCVFISRLGGRIYPLVADEIRLLR